MTSVHCGGRADEKHDICGYFLGKEQEHDIMSSKSIVCSAKKTEINIQNESIVCEGYSKLLSLSVTG
jgi:hypothetical protein